MFLFTLTVRSIYNHDHLHHYKFSNIKSVSICLTLVSIFNSLTIENIEI